MLRVIIDTNVLVSCFLARVSPPGLIREAFLKGEFRWCLSEALYEEYVNVLGRPSLVSSFRKAGIAEPDEFLSRIREAADWIPPRLDVCPVVPNDPDDDIVVATALATGASVIVSGDAHLLGLGEHRGVRVVAPREFVLMLRHPQ